MKYVFRIGFLFAGLWLFVFAETSSAWEGFSWTSWQEITQATKPAISSPQAGQSELIPLLRCEGAESSLIDSIQDWEKKRDRILGVLQQLIGQPASLSPLPPSAEVLEEQDQGAYIRRRLRIRSEADDFIPAYFLIPKNQPSQPAPVMIVLHQTVAQGKDEPAGIKGNPELAFGVELVQRGFLCLIPDAIGFGERIPPQTDPYHNTRDFYRKHPRWSFFGKMIWDVQRLVDWLETQPEVDRYRIGCMGHSHGAYGSILLAVFEPRISAVIASCGFNAFRKDPQPDRWSHLTPLLPNLGFYVRDIKEAPVDWQEIAACLAPRPFFYWGTLDDKIFPDTQILHNIFRDLREVYDLYGARDFLSANLAPGDHSFPPRVRELAYQWLSQRLAPRPAMNAQERNQGKDKEEWARQCAAVKNLLIHDIGPVDPPSLDIRAETLGVETKDGYEEKKIRYETAPGEFINAYLLIPDKRKTQNPGMIVFHQTVELGKEEAVGHAGRASIHFGPELARRGYIVLAPDSICAGERITKSGAFDTRDFYQQYLSCSALGKMIQDGRRALDILQALPGVDPDRIGSIGHSLGAELSLFTAAFDDRIQAAAASCGYAPMKADKIPDRWARDHWFSYMPRLRIDFRAGRLPAWDFDDVIRIIAPRGYFNYQTTGDEIFPEGSAAQAMVESLQPLWRSMGAETRLRALLEPGPHDISPAAKETVYEWLDRMLKR